MDSAENSERRVGIIGLGLVGKAIAPRLRAAGFELVGYDLDAAAQAVAADQGVQILADAAAVAAAAPRLVLSLPDSDIVAKVLWHEGGAGFACRAGACVVDATTGRPSDALENHRRLAERSVQYVDAALVGSSQEIAAGEAVALVGDAEIGATYAPVLQAFCRASYAFGGPGQGHRAKLIVNLVLGLNRLVLAEGLALAEKAGMNTESVLEALKNSAARSTVMETKGQRMISGNFEPVARLRQHAKDVRLIRELADEVGAQVPLSELHSALLQKAIDSGWGDLDNSAIIRVLQRRSD